MDAIDISYIHAPARNISIARNACVEAATGKWIAFIDDDELASENWLQHHYDEAIRKGHDLEFNAQFRCFFYLPFEHSESLSDQDRCVAHTHTLGDAEYLKYALLHRVIIRRFGRFPHRNAVLGRHTSPAEEAFLAAGGFAG